MVKFTNRDTLATKIGVLRLFSYNEVKIDEKCCVLFFMEFLTNFIKVSLTTAGIQSRRCGFFMRFLHVLKSFNEMRFLHLIKHKFVSQHLEVGASVKISCYGNSCQKFH